MARSAFTPFPGYHSTFPMWAGLLVLIIVALLVLRAILRCRPSDDPHDILLRRRSSTSVLGAVVLASALCLLPVASLAVTRLLSSDGFGRTSTPEQVCIGLGGVGILVGLLALPVGLVMVVFPEILARRSRAPTGATRTPGIAIDGLGAGAAQEVGR